MKYQNFTHLVTEWDLDDAFMVKDIVLERPMNGAEPTLANGATGFDLSPLHDAKKAEVMVAAIDFASD